MKTMSSNTLNPFQPPCITIQVLYNYAV